MAKTAGWTFLEKPKGYPGMSTGNITRVFNTGDSRPPASFSSMVDRNNPDAISAVIYAREGVANCLDASVARHEGKGTLGLRITFAQHSGAAAKRLWDQLGLSTLADRAKAKGVDRQGLGLSPKDCLSEGPAGGIRTLLVEERAGGGMPGRVADEHSVLARALIAVGEAQVSKGAAGSYGYGKAAVAQASRIRAVFAYTCAPPEKKGDPSTRLLGVAYWGDHETAGAKYTGWTLFGHGNPSDKHIVDALEGSEADAVARSLGIPVRNPADPQDRGTSFLIVDPAFDADQLRSAIELFWWPLLQKTRDVHLEVTITDEQGRTTAPSVDHNHPLLDQFVEAFHSAERRAETQDDIVTDDVVVRSGHAGIVSLQARRPGSPVMQSLVARMRSPLMVVNYLPPDNPNRPVLGVFVAHDQRNENLRRVEPPEHDKWLAQNVSGLNASPADIAVSKSVREEVFDAVKEFRPPEPPPIEGVDAFARHFPAVDVKVARPQKERLIQTKQRLVHVHLVHPGGDEKATVERPQRTITSTGQLTAMAEAKFFLDEARALRVGIDTLKARITVGLRISEDGGEGDWLPASVQQARHTKAQAWTRTSGPGESPAVFFGEFRRGRNVFFTVESEPYHPDWTATVILDCDPWDVPTPNAKARREETDNAV